MKLDGILKEVFNVDGGLTDDTRIMAFSEWDSMSHMLLITRLEEVYEINLTGDEIASMQTVGDVRKIIVSKGKTL